MTKPTLLVIDDEPEIAELIEFAGRSVGFDVTATYTADGFRSLWKENAFAVIVMDVVIPDMDANELVQWLVEKDIGDKPIILMSGFGGTYLDITQKLAKSKGANIVGTLTKPFEITQAEELLSAVKNQRHL